MSRLCHDVLVVSVSASPVFGRLLVHTKDPHKDGTNCLPVWHTGIKPDCVIGWVVCGTVYGNMLFLDLLGSIARVGYCILIPDFIQCYMAFDAEKAL